ncbi:hypothetical protein BJX96DRAFT_124958 [Aspergillus floccosus]
MVCHQPGSNGGNNIACVWRYYKHASDRAMAEGLAGDGRIPFTRPHSKALKGRKSLKTGRLERGLSVWLGFFVLIWPNTIESLREKGCIDETRRTAD